MVRRQSSEKKFICGVCGESFTRHQGFGADYVRPEIANHLDTDQPGWRKSGFICKADLANARRRYIEDLIRRERGELSALDRQVVDALTHHEVIARDVEEDMADNLPFGAWLADRVASFGGSWTFISIFGGVLVLWMAFNAVSIFAAERFDPYPFILLNLALSCLAAVQAPLIMMSQRRQEEKDRQRSQNDYRINLKAELEIRQLHEKLDHLVERQWERLAEIQEVLLEQMEDIRRH
ncbi:Uncharacterized membrane protein [Ensifer adhaerens]|nr:Uncharacterized membrane protein [Ensifer adhaerens]HZG27537.1 DUF1003 domain-containing protein [Ensifer sp.]